MKLAVDQEWIRHDYERLDGTRPPDMRSTSCQLLATTLTGIAAAYRRMGCIISEDATVPPAAGDYR